MSALLDKDAVARRLDVAPAYVLRLARRKVLPAVRVGKYVRFTRDDVEAYLAANRTAPPIVVPDAADPVAELPPPSRRRFS